MKKINLEIIDLFYGYKCNLACKDCNPGSDIIKDTQYDPDLDSILESVNYFSQYVNVTRSLTLLGGEPMLYWQDRIVPIARHIRKMMPSTRIAIPTNGTLLHKNADDIIDLLLEIDNIELQISNHMSDWPQDPMAIKYNKNLLEFLSHEKIYRIHQEHYDIPNHQIDIRLVTADTFIPQWRWQDGQVKPFATKDNAGSFRNGCCGPVCSGLIDSKLYKCAKLFALPHILKHFDQLDDPDWQHYLSYQPVDLRNPTEQQIQQFGLNQGHATEFCDMCTNNRSFRIQQTKENVLPR
jgi:organic radical activating enzyme